MVRFGLGAAGTCDVTVTWPGKDRATTTFRGLKAGTHWVLDRATGKAAEAPLKPFEVAAGN